MAKLTCAHNRIQQHTLTYRLTRQVLGKFFPFVWQTDVLNHLIHLSFNLLATASFEPGVEVNVLFHCQPGKVDMTSQRLLN